MEKFDYIHDIQNSYRKLLDSMAKPGRINNIKEEVDKLEVHSKLSKELMLLADVLLNLESSFYIKELEFQHYIKLHTFAKVEKVEEAEFIFVDRKNYSEEEFRDLLEKVRIGTLQDPHLGGTLIVKVEKITEDSILSLKGPGIKDKKYLGIVGLSREFIEKREEINSEFPMGVDMIFVDNSGNLVCIPRTTEVEVSI